MEGVALAMRKVGGKGRQLATSVLNDQIPDLPRCAGA